MLLNYYFALISSRYRYFKLNVITLYTCTLHVYLFYQNLYPFIFTLTETCVRIDNVQAHHTLAMFVSVICSTSKGKFQSDWSAYGLPRIPNTAAYCLWRNRACESEI